MEFFKIDGAAAPAGHYSPATKVGNIIFISGQVPVDPATGKPCGGTLEEQARQVFSNLFAVAKAAGARREDIAKVVVYLSDVSYWPEVNKIYTELFGDHKPARTAVPVSPLRNGYMLEADAFAVLP